MRPLRFFSVCMILLGAFAQAQSTPSITRSLTPSGTEPTVASAPNLAMRAELAASYGKLPLTFEANRGQTNDTVKFLSRTSSYTLFLTSNEAVLAFHQAAPSAGPLRMKLLNANAQSTASGVDELAATASYFIGNDPAKWKTKIPTFAKVKYQGIYPGIDLVYYGNQRQLEYDFIVAPGADPRSIVFDIVGASIRQAELGDLVFTIGADEIRWHQPVVYQKINGMRQQIAAHYAITAANRVSFELAPYDRTAPLYIDPLIYATYLGGANTDVGYGIAIDGAGNAYIAGQTYSTDFPITTGAFQTACTGKAGRGCYKNGEAFIAKLNPEGSALLYSTYLGGSGGDAASSIAIDRSGNAYITGQTFSSNFPVTSGAFQKNCKGKDPCGKGDVFVTKLDPSGSALIYSTYLGGSGTDWAASIAIDKIGNAYVTGGTSSTNFPVTRGAFQTECRDKKCSLGDAFVTKLDPSGSALIYSTYLGGIAIDYGRGIAVDKAGNAYITGGTTSRNFPVTPGAFQTICGDPNCYLDDAFVAKLNSTGSALIYSTYLGGNDYDIGTGIVLDTGDHAYVVGWTGSTDFPTRNPLQAFNAGAGDLFIAKLNPSGSALDYSTYLGGDGQDNGNSIAIDSAGNVFVTGSTSSNNFPTLHPIQSSNFGYVNIFVAEISHAGSSLVYSTYLGGSYYDAGVGIAVDNAGNAYVTGDTASTDFPTLNPFQGANQGGSDAFAVKIGSSASKAVKQSPTEAQE
jgi:Beta-propeller repeat